MSTMRGLFQAAALATAILAAPGCFNPSWPNMCFLAGTMIATPEGEVAIEALTIGQTVLAFDDETGKVTAGIVEKLTTSDADDYLEVEASNGRTLAVTGEHIMAIRGTDGIEWVQADQLSVDSRLYGMTETSATDKLTIRDVRKIARSSKVYNIKVRRYHTSFANGILTHFYYDSLAEMQAHHR